MNYPNVNRFDIVEHLYRQREFSQRTFGPGTRTAAVLDHIRKELKEVEDDPANPSEWADVIILGFDGAMRAGIKPERIIEAIEAKQTKNEGRKWPDWRTADPDKAIEHIKESVPAPEPGEPKVVDLMAALEASLAAAKAKKQS